MTSSILDIIIEPVKRVKRTFYFSQLCSPFFLPLRPTCIINDFEPVSRLLCQFRGEKIEIIPSIPLSLNVLPFIVDE